MTQPIVPASGLPPAAEKRKSMPLPASKLRVDQIVAVERNGVSLRFRVQNIFADAIVMARRDPQWLTVVATRHGDEMELRGERLIVELIATPMDN